MRIGLITAIVTINSKIENSYRQVNYDLLSHGLRIARF